MRISDRLIAAYEPSTICETWELPSLELEASDSRSASLFSQTLLLFLDLLPQPKRTLWMAAQAFLAPLHRTLLVRHGASSQALAAPHKADEKGNHCHNYEPQNEHFNPPYLYA
jgi:hypothetical protein